MNLVDGHTRRGTAHYLTAAVILAVYGVQVCPFLESLTPTQLALPIFITLVVQYFLRIPARRIWVLSAPLNEQVARVLKVELGLFLAGGLAILIYNSVIYDFPVVSGLKVVVGMATLGFFASIDLSLEWQRKILENLTASGEQMEVDESYFPLSGKIGVFAASCVLFSTGVIFLLINKDLYWLLNEGSKVSLHTAQLAILTEISFVVVLLLIQIVNVIYAYTRNLRAFFHNQNSVLSTATHGDLNASVPVGSNDEFGLMALHTNQMIKGLRETTEEVRRTRDVAILSLASLAETRDNETGAHILRTQRYIRALALRVQDHPKFKDYLSDETIDLLYKSAPLHDVGKVGIPDNILLKPGKLTDEEFEIMKTHTTLGAESLAVAEKELGSTSFLRYAKEIALTHQEKWDGSGYPQKLKGDQIPISGRLMAIADVYDALISKRVYKPAFSHEKACEIILEGRDKHFDPDLIDAFAEISQEFADIAEQFRDMKHQEAA
ncbi:MAG: HD domain-containing protein [Rhodospirillales bacterium]|nr:HD domain-containing protein [Rhodospirillales bacterium]